MARTPTAVEQNAKRAEELIKAGNTGAEGNPPEPTVTPTVTPEPVVTPAPETPPSKEASEQPAQLTQPLGEESDPWETKYSILQGKYNKEVPAMHGEIKSLKERLAQSASTSEIEGLRAEIDRLKAELAKQPPATVMSPGLDKLREDYSPELVDGILAHVQSLVAPIKQQIADVGQSTANVTRNTAVDALRATLKNDNIDYDRLNNDPLFVEDYLQQPDPYSGVTRHKLLKDAFQAGDIERAALFFRSYANSHTPSPSATPPDLDRHVQVPPTTPVTTPTTVKNVWNAATIAQFYEDKRKGRYTADEAAALESELFASTCQ